MTSIRRKQRQDQLEPRRTRMAAARQGVKSGKKAAAPIPNLENLVAVRIVRLSELIQRMAARQFEPRFGLRNTDLRILNLLDGSDAISVSEISRRTHVDKAWISRSLHELAGKGLVAKTAHATDARQALISLTAAGRALLTKVRPIAVAHEEGLLDGIDRASLLADLDRLAQNAERAYAEMMPPVAP
jgi:DNA-binding MarR family transcriptional regulator